MNVPRFVVVGCVNMGKSSLVSTLTEQDWIPIDRRPGTTREADAYDLTVDGRPVLTIYDTPGFQNARRCLAWCEEWRAAHAADSPTWPETLRAFVAAHAGQEDSAFCHEVRLLGPVLDGAGIVYVVNGSLPFHGRYEAEMRLLANTGAPRLAVINLDHGEEPLPEWTEALSPYFKVHRFDALGAGTAERLALLRSFAGVDETWAPAVEAAVERLAAAADARRERSAELIADLIGDCLSMHEDAPLADRDDRTRLREGLQVRLAERLRAREHAARRQIEHCYRHENLRCREAELPILDYDLLDRRLWRLAGLSLTRLGTIGALSGAAVGGVIDASLGGADFMLGSVLGAAIGGVGALVGTRQLARARILGRRLGGWKLRVSPPADPQLAFVLLDRALIHWRLVSTRAHARQDAPDLTQLAEPLVERRLDRDLQKRYARIGKRLAASCGQGIDDADRRRLISLLREAMAGIDCRGIGG